MKMKKILTAAAIVGIISAMGIAYAASAKTPAEIVSGLTGKSTEELTAQRNEGTTYGQIAEQAGKLEEFQAEMLEQRKAMLDERVQNGTLTQEQADRMYSRMQSNQASCDGSGARGAARGGCGYSSGGCGGGQGMGYGRGMSRR